MAEPASSLLAGKTALITGAAGGLGREITRGLLAAGARVIATDVDEHRLDALAEWTGRPSGLQTHCLDIADERACSAAVAAVHGSHGGLDILVNNGALGITVIRDDAMTNLAGIDEITPEVWDRMIAVNLSGAWYLTRAAVPAMRRAGWGRIITVTTSFFTMLRANSTLTGRRRPDWRQWPPATPRSFRLTASR
jgi:NAD(P)-dependent dehydrogenase (short-subunit alcohol dehydrogenase family)